MRLGVFLPSWIGDTCMATPALRAIRDGLPNATIVGIAKPAPIALLKSTRFIDEWISFQTKGCPLEGRWKLVRELHAASLEGVLLLTNSLSTAIVTYLARIPRRIGYSSDLRGMLLTEKVDKLSRGKVASRVSLIESYLNLTKPLGISCDDREMELTVSDEASDRVRTTLRSIGFKTSRPLIVVNNSAASAKSRLWPSQYVVHLCRQLATGMNAQVLLHCGPNDRCEANSICEQVKNPLVQSMGEWTDLPIEVSLAVFEQADVVVSSDSGPRHMAAALNKDVVSLFGSTDPEPTRTFNKQETILQSFEECRPCYKTDCPLKHHHCMRNIEVDSVRSAIEQRLQDKFKLRIAC